MSRDSFRSAYEELGYEGPDGCQFTRLIDCLKIRDAQNATLFENQDYQDRLWKALRDHGQTTFSHKLGNSLRQVHKNQIPESYHLKPRVKSEFRPPDLILRMSDSYIHSLLNLWTYPDLLENALRMRLLYAITKKRYEGFWQFALAKELKLEPKTIFQHLKPLYRYDLVVRLSLVLPTGMKKTEAAKRTSTGPGQMSMSGVLWLRRFFDLTRIPKELVQIYLTQQIDPFRNAVRNLLNKQPNHILLERDFRAYFIAFFVSKDAQGSFLCSPKTVARFYLRMRRELIAQNIVQRVRAWCPSAGNLECCIILVTDGMPQSHKLPSVDEDDDERPQTASTRPQTATDLPSVEPINTEAFETRTDIESDGMEEEEELVGDMADSLSPLPWATQVLEILRVVGNRGIVTPDLATLLRTTTKRLSKVLAVLEQYTVVSKRAQRQGKFFMYRYYLPSQSPAAMLALEDHANVVKNIKTDKRAVCKTFTEQFYIRVGLFKQWVHTSRVTMIPDLAKKYADLEGTVNGPDRRTILRLAKVAMEEDPQLCQGRASVGSQELLFFYSKRSLDTCEEAAALCRQRLSDKRSEACREAIRRGSQLALALKTRGDPDSHKKAASVDEINRKLVQHKNQHGPIPPSDNIILSDVHVEPRLDKLVPLEARNDPFSQSLLAHYGYIFPVMIRLKHLHIHLMRLFNEKATSNQTELVLPASEIIGSLTLDAYLRLIGYGYRDEYVEAYFHGSTPRCPNRKLMDGANVATEISMSQLPPEVFSRLINGPQSNRNMRSHSRRSAYGALHTLFVKLHKIGLVNQQVALGTEDASPQPYVWAVKATVNLFKFVTEAEGIEATSLVGSFDVRTDEGLESFWKGMKNEVEDWLRRFARDTRADSLTSRGMRGHVYGSISEYPLNMSFTEAFSKKNWKGQILMSTETRAGLDALAERVVQKANAGDNLSEADLCILNPQSAEIRQTAQKLQLSPDVIIRYLHRYFSTAGNSKLLQMVQGHTGRVTIHASRDLRYRCHLCGFMYAQLPSMAQHYKQIHGRELPSEEAIWVLPTELDRRKRKSVAEVPRRKRRRKLFSVDEKVPSLDRTRFFEERVHRLFANATDDSYQSYIGETQESSVWEKDWELRTEGMFENRLSQKDVDLLTELTVMSDDEEDLSQQSVEFQEAYKRLKLTHVEKQVLRAYLQDARRDDEYEMITFLVAIERLRAAEGGTCSNEDSDSLPPLTDRVWELFSAFHPAQRFPPAAAHFLTQYCLHRCGNTLTGRILSTYKRLSGCDLRDALSKFSLPIRLNIRETHPLEFPHLTNRTTSNSLSSEIKAILGRTLLKSIVLSQPSRYRPWWGCEMTKELTESEMQVTWRFWNRIGWMVLAKRSISATLIAERLRNDKVDLPSPVNHMFHWDLLCKRRYTLARAFEIAVFGRHRDWTFLRGAARQSACLSQAYEAGCFDSEYRISVRGLKPYTTASVIEAHAANKITFGLGWTDGEAPYMSQDPWASVLTEAEEGEMAVPIEHQLIAAMTAGLTDPQTEVQIAPEEMDDPMDESDVEEDALDDEDGLNDEKSDFFNATGVQEHLCKLTRDAPDVNRLTWRLHPATEEAIIRCPRTRILAWDVDLNLSLCGIVTTEKGQATDAMGIDPWLLPCTLVNVHGTFSDDAQHDEHLTAEKDLEFVDDAFNSWSAEERRVKVAEDPRALLPPARTPSERRRKDPSPTLALASKSAEFSDNAYFCISSENESNLIHQAAYEPFYSIRGDPNLDVDAETFFANLLERVSAVHRHLFETLLRDEDRRPGFVSALLWVHKNIMIAGPAGVYQIDLRKSFCQEMTDYYTFHDELHNDFLSAMVALESMRAVVKIPAISDWRVMSPENALMWTIKIRQVKKTESFKSVIDGTLMGSIEDTGNEMTDRDIHAALDHILADDVLRPAYVPVSIWDSCGPSPGSMATMLSPLPHKSLDGEGRRAVSTLIKQSARALRKLCELQTAFADLRASYADQTLQMSETSDLELSLLFGTTSYLGVLQVPPRTWIRTDGRVHGSLVGGMIVRLWTVLRETPGLSVSSIESKLPLLDRCELIELIDALVEDGLLIASSRQHNSGSVSVNVPRSGVKLNLTQECRLDAGDPCSDTITVYSCHLANFNL